MTRLDSHRNVMMLRVLFTLLLVSDDPDPKLFYERRGCVVRRRATGAVTSR